MNPSSEKREIELVPASNEWKFKFKKEAGKLEKIFTNQIGIHHIGSTAIDEIKAKPVIDILIVVKDISLVNGYVKEMERADYVYKGPNGMPGRRYFEKGYPVHTHHLHVFEDGNQEIERHLLFRDYLNAHPEEASTYSSLKEKLAKEYRTDPVGYTRAKGDFIREIDKKARDWKSKK